MDLLTGVVPGSLGNLRLEPERTVLQPRLRREEDPVTLYWQSNGVIFSGEKMETRFLDSLLKQVSI